MLNGQHTVGVSIGISLSPDDGEDAETILRNADMAMYSAKAAPDKGSYQFFHPELYERLKGRLDSEHALLQAVELDQFVLFYQPRAEAATGEICGMEALVRWMHPQRGLVPPLEFIPLAESTGLIVKLGELVIEKACAQLAQWKAQQLPLVPVSINVSALQLNQGDVANKLMVCLAHHGVDPKLVEIEITESSIMGRHPEIDAQLSMFRELGIKLVIDDFGTGYSSLSQLHRLEMDVLKVDQTFISELGQSKRGEVFVKSIILMAHALEMTVVAEGVETEKQLRVLQSLACDEVQGYFISRPVPADKIPALMRKGYHFSQLTINVQS